MGSNPIKGTKGYCTFKQFYVEVLRKPVKKPQYAPVAQLAEYFTCNEDVAGSIPVWGSKLKKQQRTVKTMNTIDALKIRIHTLQMRDPVGNARIINKLKRKVRSLEN